MLILREKIRIGNKLYFGENDELIAEVIDNTTSRGRNIEVLHDAPYDEFKKQIETLGATPLPKCMIENLLKKMKKSSKRFC